MQVILVDRRCLDYVILSLRLTNNCCCQRLRGNLIRALLPLALHPQTVIINVSSDAGVEHYETWGGYGSSKSALDHPDADLGGRRPTFRWSTASTW